MCIFPCILSHSSSPPVPHSPPPGLEVRVAFGGVWKQSLTELSGGQRSLLALSLILALLLFKPAPLYLLDEVSAGVGFRGMLDEVRAGVRVSTRGGSQCCAVQCCAYVTDAQMVWLTGWRDAPEERNRESGKYRLTGVRALSSNSVLKYSP